MNAPFLPAGNSSHDMTRSGFRLNADRLRQLPLIGNCVRLQYQQAWLSVHSAALSRHPLKQAEFLVLIAKMDMPLFSPVLVVRVEDWESTNAGALNNQPPLLRCAIVGSFTPPAAHSGVWHFSTIPTFSHFPHELQVHVPNAEVLHDLVNGGLSPEGQFDFGHLRFNDQYTAGSAPITTRIAISDLISRRTALFGKTRFGKSNVVKLLTQAMLNHTRQTQHVGQLLFDVSGEYSSINPSQGGMSLAADNPGRCNAFFLTERQSNTAGRLMRFNFHQTPDLALEVFRELLPEQVVHSDMVGSVLTCRFADLQANPKDSDVMRYRQLRKIMLFWAVLDSAGFAFDEKQMKSWLTSLGFMTPFNPRFNSDLRQAAYQAIRNGPAPSTPQTMAALISEINTVAKFKSIYRNDPSLMQNNQPCFDNEEDFLLRFLCVENGQGPSQLRPCLPYHSPMADDFIANILASLEQGYTSIIDLSNSNEKVIRYFTEKVCSAMFARQEDKFNRHNLRGRYVQIFFEEAHAIFPPQISDINNIYARIAKEGAKFHIGIAYATQSPSTVNPDLLAQTENFFIGHLSSQKEVDCICEMQVAFQGTENAIRLNRIPGLMQVLTHSHRYVVPMQAKLYTGPHGARA